MEAVWFVFVAFLLTGYVVLDGFDLGAGAIYFLVAKTKEERASVLRSIGPVWDGNEVWLIAAGGTLLMAFPRLFSAAFSGFYLPLTIFVWLIVLRGLAIELRGHFAHRVWVEIWDVVFSGSSLLLATVLGVALGNVVRGVPLDGDGWFFTPLWTDLTHAGELGVIDWYTMIVGVTALSALSLHGAAWVGLKTSRELESRALALAGRLWWSTALATSLMTGVSFSVQPQLAASLAAHPLGLVLPMIAIVALASVRVFVKRRRARRAFFGSSVYLAAMIGSAAQSLYPYVLPATTNPAWSLTTYNAAAPSHGLSVALWWWVPGMLLVLAYTAFVYRTFAGKVDLAE